jgi:hypothetical protein
MYVAHPRSNPSISLVHMKSVPALQQNIHYHSMPIVALRYGHTGPNAASVLHGNGSGQHVTGAVDAYGNRIHIANDRPEDAQRHGVEREIDRLLKSFGQEADAMSVMLRRNPAALFGNTKVDGWSINRTIDTISSMVVGTKKLITHLNLSAKHLMRDQYFTSNLFNTANAMHDVLDGVRNYEVTECGCLWSAAYNNNKRLRKVCGELDNLIRSIRTDFSIEANLSGRANVHGTAGANVSMDAQANTTVQEIDKIQYNSDGRQVGTIHMTPHLSHSRSDPHVGPYVSGAVPSIPVAAPTRPSTPPSQYEHASAMYHMPPAAQAHHYRSGSAPAKESTTPGGPSVAADPYDASKPPAYSRKNTMDR